MWIGGAFVLALVGLWAWMRERTLRKEGEIKLLYTQEQNQKIPLLEQALKLKEEEYASVHTAQIIAEEKLADGAEGGRAAQERLPGPLFRGPGKKQSQLPGSGQDLSAEIPGGGEGGSGKAAAGDRRAAQTRQRVADEARQRDAPDRKGAQRGPALAQRPGEGPRWKTKSSSNRRPPTSLKRCGPRSRGAGGGRSSCAASSSSPGCSTSAISSSSSRRSATKGGCAPT